MNESIRDYITRRVRWCMAIGIGGWVMFPLSAGLFGQTTDGNLARQGLIALGVTALFGAIIGLNFLIRCPKCSAKLGQTIAMPLAFNWGSGPKIGFCPYCGVNLGEPRSTQTTVSLIGS